MSERSEKLRELYGLTENPFKEDHHHALVGADQKRTFENILQFLGENAAEGKGEGNRFLAVLKGDYGYGKSFFHFQLPLCIIKQDQLFKKIIGGKARYAISYFHILTPNKKLPPKLMLHIYRNIVENLGNGGEQFMYAAYAELVGVANAKQIPIETLLKELEPYFTRALLQLTEDSPNRSLAWRWLSGKKLTPKELTLINIPYSIDCGDEGEYAEKCIFNLLRTLKLLNYGLLVVFIDEVEQIITTVNEKSFFKCWMVLQQIWDEFGALKYEKLRPMTPVGFIAGLTEDAWDKIETEAESNTGIEAVRSRIYKNIFTIIKFDAEETTTFIKVLMENYRIPNYDKGPIFPFEKEVINPIWVLAYGNPRYIIHICHKLLNLALKTGKKTIDAALFEEYRRESGGSSSIQLPNEEGGGDQERLDDEEEI